MSDTLATAVSAAGLTGLGELRRVAIVPALNEEHALPALIDELRAFDPGLDVVVVDDGSIAPVLRGDADIVVGSRFAAEGPGYRSSRTRRIGIRLLAWVVSRIVGQRVTDTTSGFQALNREGIALFARDYPHDYPEVEATVMVFRHRLRLTEVPVSMRERGGGRSSITALRSIYYMVKVLLAIFVGLFRRNVVPQEDSL